MNILRKERILSRFALRMTSCLVIAVRVSGGHLCEAEAPTEPAGETAARCVAIRLFFKGNADSFMLRAQKDKEQA